MKKGEILRSLLISSIASNGKALGRHDGQVVFVDKLIPGDVADVRVFKKKSKFAEARLIKLVQPSNDRIQAKCTHFGICGGCKWQHMSYEHQLKHKEQHVSENLRKLSGVTFPEAQVILGSEAHFEYRNKMEYTFSNSSWLTEEEIKSGQDFSNRNALGFHVPGRFDKIVQINKCYLQHDFANDIRNFIKDYANKHALPFFDLRAQTGLLRNLIIRNTSIGEWMVILATTEWNESVKDLMTAVKEAFSQITSLNYVVNAKKNDTISDLNVICFSGRDHIVEKMKNLTYKIGPKSFYQTNSKQAELLYDIVKTHAKIKSTDLVYDLYTGTGTIANFLADEAKKVVGIEYVEEAVADARTNAELNQITNTEFFAGDMQKILTEDFYVLHGKPDVIVADPPRAGMHSDVVKHITKSGARKIVYVSCNSATQARDLEMMDEKYNVVFLQAVDMFPHTAHVENVVVLEKR